MSESKITSESVVCKLRETEALSFLENDPESILSVLRERKFYNISAEEVQTWRGKESLPPSHPAPSNQGRKYTCSSHALGKAVTDIFDGFNYDCDQDDIIKRLENNVQPTGQAKFIENFTEKSVIVNFWKKGLESTRKCVEVHIITQRETVDSNWTGPKLRKEELKNHNMSLVACGLVHVSSSKSGKPQKEPHALYVDKCHPVRDPKNKHRHQFTCINSWGLKDPFPQLKSVDEVYQLHYVSLYTVAQLEITSPGKSGEMHSDYFGIYDQVINNDAILFKQRHSKSDDDSYILKRTETGFAVGTAESCMLTNEEISGPHPYYIITASGEKCHIPLSQWKYFGTVI